MSDPELQHWITAGYVAVALVVMMVLGRCFYRGVREHEEARGQRGRRPYHEVREYEENRANAVSFAVVIGALWLAALVALVCYLVWRLVVTGPVDRDLDRRNERRRQLDADIAAWRAKAANGADPEREVAPGVLDALTAAREEA